MWYCTVTGGRECGDITRRRQIGCGLEKLGRRFRLVALSNGDWWFLGYLVRERIRFELARVISVEEIGAFKPHASLYRAAAWALGAGPHQLMMVSAHSFDVIGAH